MSAKPPSLKPGEVVGNYRVVRFIGGGGMGDVYEMVHCHIARRAALKVLTLGAKDLHIATRFVNEARAANIISHPGIVQIFEYGQFPSGSPWLLMEYVEGETLFARLDDLRQGRTLRGHDHLSLLYQLASTLAAVHASGIIHRDLKPGNIILTPDPTRPEGEHAKLLDFGIAKLLHNSLHELPDGRLADQGTAVGMILGTPTYMAPEQGRSAASVDVKADVYSLGVVAYELLTGRVPFVGEAFAVLAFKQSQDPPPITGPALSRELKQLVMNMLQRDPAQRPAMATVAETLAGLGGRGVSGAQLRALRLPASRTPIDRIGAEHLAILLGFLLLLVGCAAGWAVFVLLGKVNQHPLVTSPDLLRGTAPDDLATQPVDLSTPAMVADLAILSRSAAPHLRQPDKRPSAEPSPGTSQSIRPVVQGLFGLNIKLSVEQNALVAHSAMAKALCRSGLELTLIEKGQWLAPVLPLPAGLDEARLKSFCDYLQLQWIKRYPGSHPLRVEIRCLR